MEAHLVLKLDALRQWWYQMVLATTRITFVINVGAIGLGSVGFARATAMIIVSHATRDLLELQDHRKCSGILPIVVLVQFFQIRKIGAVLNLIITRESLIHGLAHLLQNRVVNGTTKLCLKVLQT